MAAAQSDPVEELEAALAASASASASPPPPLTLRLRLSTPTEPTPQPQPQPQPQERRRGHRRQTLAEGRERRVVRRNVLYGEVQELSEEFQRCLTIVDSLLRTDAMAPFYEPVDPVALGLPTYRDVVKTPMDLGTVKANILGGRYGSSRAFADDMRLMFRNALAFNPAGSFVHDVAATYLRHFEAAYESQVAAYVRTHMRRATGAAAGRLHTKLLRAVSAASAPSHAPPAKRPAPAAAPAPAAEADEGERQRLAVILQNFPGAHAAALLRLCRARLALRARSVSELGAAVSAMDAAALPRLSAAITDALTLPPEKEPLTPPTPQDNDDDDDDDDDEKTEDERQQVQEEEEEEEQEQAVSPFMQRVLSPAPHQSQEAQEQEKEKEEAGKEGRDGAGAPPRILCCESACPAGVVVRPEVRSTWSLLAARTPPPASTATPPPPPVAQEGAPATPDRDAWSQFRAQTVLREQREQLRARSLEEKRAMLEAAERARAAHLARLAEEARAARAAAEAQRAAERAAEHARLERERAALRQRVAEAADADTDADAGDDAGETEMYAALQRDARAGSSLLQLDSTLLLDDLPQQPPSSSSSSSSS